MYIKDTQRLAIGLFILVAFCIFIGFLIGFRWYEVIGETDQEYIEAVEVYRERAKVQEIINK